MNPRSVIVAFACLVLATTAFFWKRSQAIRAIHAPRPPAAGIEDEKHKVTPAMLVAAETRAGQPAPAFRRTAADGMLCDLDEMRARGPVVLVFIKDGCPCSVSAEIYFNGLHAAYRGQVRFLGVIDGDARVARRWAAANGVPFPIIPDPKLTLMHAYGATNSAYLALIDRDGRLDAYWPGYSDSMLHELNARIATLAGLNPEPIETPDAPDELYSGCPFD